MQRPLRARLSRRNIAFFVASHTIIFLLLLLLLLLLLAVGGRGVSGGQWRRAPLWSAATAPIAPTAGINSPSVAATALILPVARDLTRRTPRATPDTYLADGLHNVLKPDKPFLESNRWRRQRQW